jgi:ssRNA-specific RNase YbeY (16S rRNA maturation enzyme)
MINIISSSRYKVNKKHLKTVMSDFLVEKKLSSDWIVNIIFVGKTKMKSITETYKHEKETLPVLSFPINSEVKEANEKTLEVISEKLLGEVFICYPLSVLLAAERNKRVEFVIDDLVKHGVNNLIK